MRQIVKNSKGEEVKLNAIEQGIADSLQLQVSAAHIKNALGYEIDITTLTSVIKSVTEQKFFTVRPSEFMPVKVGEGAWSAQMLKYTSSNIAGDFETGVINTGAANTRLAEADAGVSSATIYIKNWAKSIGWSLFDLKLAATSGNWDLVSAKERSRKKNWDLGIQEIAFYGSKIDSNVDGLLTQSGVNSNTTLITELISGTTAAEFNAVIRGIYEAYRSNSVRTAEPTHFIIPEKDYNGLASFPDSTYPLKTKLEILEETMKRLSKNPNFKVLPCAYCDQTTNASISGLNKNRYVLLNYDEDTLRMDIPVDYTSTIANSINNFQFQNVGYGQFAGVNVFRPLEVLYFDWSA